MWFDVLFYCVALSPAPPLTVENIVKAVEGVKDTKELALALNAAYMDGSNIKDVVEMFVVERGRYKQLSWRAVIITLDVTGETHVANQIRHYAEPVHVGRLHVMLRC